MAISIRCTKCSRDYKLGTRVYKKCAALISNSRKYKVSCKLPNGKWKSKIVATLDLAPLKSKQRLKYRLSRMTLFQSARKPHT